MTLYDNPLDSAENPEISLPEYYGQAMLDAYYCILVKGVGKQPFDETQHRLEDRRTAIKLGILPIAEQNVTKDIFKEYIAEFGAWARYTLPSIKAVGLALASVNGAWVRMGYVKDGTTYQNRNGEPVDSLTLKLLEVYASEDACRAAYLNRTVTSGQEPAQPTQAAPVNGNGNGANPKEKETALQFVKVLIGQVAGDEGLLAARIANMPQLSKHFTIQSPEVRAALDAYAFDQLSKQAA